MSKVIEIKSEHWFTLRDKFLCNWPQEYLGYYMINNYIRWKQQDSKLKNVNFYSLDGDWSDGTFVIIVSVSTNVYWI